MDDEIEIITLDMKGRQLMVKKKELIDNSDYFKAMFTNNFIENNKKIIKLNDADYKSFEIILALLRGGDFIIPDEHIHVVLYTARVHQFSEVTDICIENLNNFLNPRNCLLTWNVTELLDISPLYLKAKSLSLIEFSKIRDMECLTELNIRELYRYLSNRQLKCRHEIAVYGACMQWWYSNATKKELKWCGLDETQVFLCLLSCIDFRELPEEYVNEMMVYPDISTNREVTEILKNILALRRAQNREESGNACTAKAKELFNCKSRENWNTPCVIADNLEKFCMNANINPERVQVIDRYKRKRTSIVIDGLGPLRGKLPKCILLYDTKRNNFYKIADVPKEKTDNLKGYQVIAYKELIFLLGGEVSLGRGNWNYTVSVYDTYQDKWQLKTKLPFGRRHFEVCVAGGLLFVIGGTGAYRVIQDNVFYYDYKSDQWGPLISLPCQARQIKCCNYNEELFVFDRNNKCGYLLDATTKKWHNLPIVDDRNLVRVYPELFSLFCYKNCIYVKGFNITQLKIFDYKLYVMQHRDLTGMLMHDKMESVLCHNALYTIYKQTTEDLKVLTMEKFNLETMEATKLYEYITDEVKAEVCADKFQLTMDTKLFNMQHYTLVNEDDYISKFDF